MTTTVEYRDPAVTECGPGCRSKGDGHRRGNPHAVAIYEQDLRAAGYVRLGDGQTERWCETRSIPHEVISVKSGNGSASTRAYYRSDVWAPGDNEQVIARIVERGEFLARQFPHVQVEQARAAGVPAALAVVRWINALATDWVRSDRGLVYVDAIMAGATASMR